MIVRDEQDNLPSCLSSVAGLFDEIVVVDTGSTDRTREIALEFGARVFDFVWVDDFAAARNAALARATGDYAFWLDADDVLDPPQRAAAPKRCSTVCGRGERGRLRGPLLVRSRAERRRRADGGRPHPALPAPRGRSLDLSPSTSRSCPALRRANVPVRWTDVDCPPHGLHRPGAARAEAPAGQQDPRGRARRAARGSVRALQPGLNRRRAAGLAIGPGLPPSAAWPVPLPPIRSRASSSP